MAIGAFLEDVGVGLQLAMLGRKPAAQQALLQLKFHASFLMEYWQNR